jgi:hypothetical protein
MADNWPDNDKSLNAAFPETNNPAGLQFCLPTTDVGASSVNSILDVNKIVAAAQLYNGLNNIANQLFGYEARWFRAVPQQRSKDVIFLEYTLSNVEEEPLCIKIVIPGGNVPDSKYTFDLMGMEYEVPLEIQIDKKYWESIAGFGTAPQKKDIVYLPIPNKLYEVESAYLLRGFMEQETTWKCNLKKYSSEVSRRESVALQETIDKYTVSVEEVFGGAIQDDIKKLVDDQQMSQFSGTSKDKYKYFDASLRTIPRAIEMYGTVIAQSFYDMQTSGAINAITYNVTDTIHINDDRSILAWIMPRTIPIVHKEYVVKSMTYVSTGYDDPSANHYESNYDITINSQVLFNIDDTFVISRPGALSFYATVLAISETPVVYHCKVDTLVKDYLTSIKADWVSQANYKMMLKSPINLIDGMNANATHNFSVNIYANQYVKINYGVQEYISILTNKLLDNKWYGIVINIGNTWNQYNIYIWEKHDTDKNAKLQNMFYKTIDFTPEEVYIANFTINKSPSYLTNLRIYTATIEEERQSRDLLSYFTRDADQIVIADSGDQILKIPYIGKQR